MYRLFRSLQKLQWQLSLSYLLVVVIAIPVLVGMAWALVALTPAPTPAQQLVQRLADDVAPRVPQRIDGQHAATRTRLNVWAINLVLDQHSVKAARGLPVPQLNAAETLAVVILDRQGRVAGSDPLLPANNPAIDPSSLSFFVRKLRINAPASQQVIRAAFANEQDAGTLVNTLPDGQTLAAVPLLDSQQNVDGVLFVNVRGLRNDPQAESSPWSKLFSWLPTSGAQTGARTMFLPYVLLLLLVLSVLGSIFGMLTARRITRRLQRITTAAHAWSAGDFQVYVADPSPDELGQLSRDLNHMAQQIEKLVDTQQQLATLEERQRVARDLHDAVKQQAFALTLLIGAAQTYLPDEPALAQGQLLKAGGLADEMRQELTAILQQLRPVALVGQGLAAALRNYLGQWSRQTGITCEFQVVGSAEPSGLSTVLEETLFRIVQEALANVARHSQASQVQVQLESGSEQLCLRVTDNGRGFAVEQVTDGHGLGNMRDRLQAHGGTLRITSVSGQTVVAGCIPYGQGTSQQENKRRSECI